jgi:hypothetical protein
MIRRDIEKAEGSPHIPAYLRELSGGIPLRSAHFSDPHFVQHREVSKPGWESFGSMREFIREMKGRAPQSNAILALNQNRTGVQQRGPLAANGR